MEELERRRNVVFVLGSPGAGKGTMCRRLAQKYGFEHVSVGDLLRREEGTVGSVYGPVIRVLGKHVPPEITLELLKCAIAESKADTFLLDGFPRSLDLLKGWNADMADRFPLKFVLFLDCPGEICRMRVVRRAEQGSGRPDDRSITFSERQQRFMTQTMRVINHFYGTNAVVRVDSRASNPDAVFQDVDRVFRTYFGLS
ncbi:UMP-CMP kinase [Ixodes scapularis]